MYDPYPNQEWHPLPWWHIRRWFGRPIFDYRRWVPDEYALVQWEDGKWEYASSANVARDVLDKQFNPERRHHA